MGVGEHSLTHLCSSLNVCFCVGGVCLHRYGPGRGRHVNREAESPDGVKAESHRPPATLADHHTRECLLSACHQHKVPHRLMKHTELFSAAEKSLFSLLSLTPATHCISHAEKKLI